MSKLGIERSSPETYTTKGIQMYIKTADGWKPLAVKSIPAGATKTLLQQAGYTNDLGDYSGYFGDKYCEAIDKYLAAGGSLQAYTVMQREKSQAIRGIRS